MRADGQVFCAGFECDAPEGETCFAPVFVNLKFNEISKTLTQVDDTMIVSVAALSRAWLDKLRADLRAMVIEEAAKLQPKTDFCVVS